MEISKALDFSVANQGESVPLLTLHFVPGSTPQMRYNNFYPRKKKRGLSRKTIKEDSGSCWDVFSWSDLEKSRWCLESVLRLLRVVICYARMLHSLVCLSRVLNLQSHCPNKCSNKWLRDKTRMDLCWWTCKLKIRPTDKILSSRRNKHSGGHLDHTHGLSFCFGW